MSERQCKVLIFDWDENVLIALQHVLEDGGVDTTITWDEIEARKLIKNTPFDLILIGDHPPQLTVEMIQRDFSLQSASCPYLILRATARERDAEHFGRLGITSVIPKRDPYRVLEQVQEHWHPKDSILDRKALTRLTPICERPRESGYANFAAQRKHKEDT